MVHRVADPDSILSTPPSQMKPRAKATTNRSHSQAPRADQATRKRNQPSINSCTVLKHFQRTHRKSTKMNHAWPKGRPGVTRNQRSKPHFLVSIYPPRGSVPLPRRHLYCVNLLVTGLGRLWQWMNSPTHLYDEETRIFRFPTHGAMLPNQLFGLTLSPHSCPLLVSLSVWRHIVEKDSMLGQLFRSSKGRPGFGSEISCSALCRYIVGWNLEHQRALEVASRY